MSNSPSASPSPSASASGSGSTQSYTDICYALNLETKRTYEYQNYDFRGIGRFNEKLIGAKDTAVYDLETAATTDDGTAIAALIELGELDFGIPNHIGIRGLYFQADVSSQISVTITKIDETVSSYIVDRNKMRSLPRHLIDKAFSIKIENVSGGQAEIFLFHQKLNVFDIGGM